MTSALIERLCEKAAWHDGEAMACAPFRPDASRLHSDTAALFLAAADALKAMEKERADAIAHAEHYTIQGNVSRVALHDAARRATASFRAKVLAAVEGERLRDNTDEPVDVAYNQAIDDVVAAVKRCLSEAVSQEDK